MTPETPEAWMAAAQNRGQKAGAEFAAHLLGRAQAETPHGFTHPPKLVAVAMLVSAMGAIQTTMTAIAAGDAGKGRHG